MNNTSLFIHKIEFHVTVKSYMLCPYVFTWVNLKISKTAFKNKQNSIYVFLKLHFHKGIVNTVHKCSPSKNMYITKKIETKTTN